MNRTEDDLRAALLALEEDAPSVASVLPPAAEPSVPLPLAPAASAERRPRRRHAIVAAAAVAALVAGGVAWLAPPGGHATHAASPPRVIKVPGTDGLGSVDFTAQSVPGYVLVGYTSTKISGQANFVARNGNEVSVTLFHAGQYDGTTTGRPVQIGGVTGHVVPHAHPAFVAFEATDPTQDQRAVVWEYAPNAFAVSTGAGRGRSAAVQDAANLRLARAIGTGSSTVRIPFQLGYLPAGLSAESAYYAGVTKVGPKGPYGGLSFRDSTAPGDAGVAWGSALDVVAYAPADLLKVCMPGSRTFTIGSDTGCFQTTDGKTSGLVITLRRHTVQIKVNSSHYGLYRDAQLVNILRHLSFAPDLRDPATWFPV